MNIMEIKLWKMEYLLVDILVETICDFLRMGIIGFKGGLLGFLRSLLPRLIKIANVGGGDWDNYQKG